MKVNMKFLQCVRTLQVKRKPIPSDDVRPDEPDSDDRSAAHLNAAIDEFMAGEFGALNFKSAMGTGKSVLLAKLLQEMKPKRVLALTSRVTIAQELRAKLCGEGFVSYLEVPTDVQPNLDDEEAFPRVICQLDSIRRLSPTLLRTFDLVILDELCSLLLHFSAPTLRDRALVLECLQHTLRHAGRIIAMDALWGEPEHHFLNMIAPPETVCPTSLACCSLNSEQAIHRSYLLVASFFSLIYRRLVKTLPTCSLHVEPTQVVLPHLSRPDLFASTSAGRPKLTIGFVVAAHEADHG